MSVSFVGGLFVWAGCGGPLPAERVSNYRQAIEANLDEIGADPTDPVRLPLPDRRARRLAVGEQRIGAFDFLAIVGCPLSEVVAIRNGPLGKLMQPTRRLAHETTVLRAAEQCLPTLPSERAIVLRERLAAKRADLPSHAWNAVWLDEDLERYLSSGPASWIGRDDPTDGSRQLKRAARALAARDVERLEAAFHALQDDAAIGPQWIAMTRVTADLERVAALIRSLPTDACAPATRRLARIFHEQYAPLQPYLGKLDRDGRESLESLAELFRASAEGVDVPDAMRGFGRELLGDESQPGLGSRYRAAVLAHAEAWGPVLEACGLSPGATAQMPRLAFDSGGYGTPPRDPAPPATRRAPQEREWRRNA